MIKGLLKCYAGVQSQRGGGRDNRLLVLIYHRVLAQPDALSPGEVTRDQFDWQMQLVSRYFNVLPLAQALEQQKSGSLPPRALAITFDDGYADNCQVALPILERYGLTATFFIASGFLDGGRMWNDTIMESVRRISADTLDLTDVGLEVFPLGDARQRAHSARSLLLAVKHEPPQERDRLTAHIAALADSSLPDDLMLSSDELRYMSERGMDIGGHTVSHPILATLTPEETQAEIAGGKSALEAIIDRELALFAYPNGKPGADFGEAATMAVSAAGFEGAVTTEWGVSDRHTDRLQIPRFTPWDRTPARFLARLATSYRNVSHGVPL